MRERNEVTEIRERFADGDGYEAQGTEAARWPRTVGLFTVLFTAAVAAGLALAGCGNRGGGGAAAESSAAVASPAAATPSQAAGTQVASAPVASGLSAGDLAVKEGLPPDLSVTVPDTLVAPGEVVEFRVVGTTDVSQVALSDGRDEPLPFVRDAGTDTWRVQYRVPLHPRQDRFGVSVTARTDLNRWRRVWVFLHVERGDTTAVDNPDEMEDRD
ncbi:MAG: hypothetical protein IT347_02545 [Candidatus Eisenbacteria bacterium]|nr:hypothetical protein [Candidatus Eisenbacteria bacterium]